MSIIRDDCFILSRIVLAGGLLSFCSPTGEGSCRLTDCTRDSSSEIISCSDIKYLFCSSRAVGIAGEAVTTCGGRQPTNPWLACLYDEFIL